MNNHILHQSEVDVTPEPNNFPQKTKQYILKPNQKVYLYDDTSFSGTLIRPLERTYPPRWTVQLDRGGYDSAIVKDITPINPQYIETDSFLPFNDEREINISYHEEKRTNSEKDNRIAQLEQEIERLKTQNQQVKNDNEILKKDLDIARNIIRRAKNISPLIRISLKRVLRLAHDACMDVQKTVGGWILRMGDKARKFRRLVDIWDILSQDNWFLSEIFAPDKLIAIDLIQAPRRRELPPVYHPRMPKPPFPITREDLLKERELQALRYR